MLITKKMPMKNNQFRTAGVLVLAAVIGGLGGCATRTHQASLYQWEGYQGNVDAYYRGGEKLSPEAQTQLMEADLQKIKAKGGAAPPGFNAHLALLYGQQGRPDQFAEKVAAEKQQFPESGTFMDFLTRNFKK